MATSRVPLSPPAGEPGVAIRGLNHWFGSGESKKHCLIDNSLTLMPGELVGDLMDVLPAGIFSLRHYEKLARIAATDPFDRASASSTVLSAWRYSAAASRAMSSPRCASMSV